MAERHVFHYRITGNVGGDIARNLLTAGRSVWAVMRDTGKVSLDRGVVAKS